MLLALEVSVDEIGIVKVKGSSMIDDINLFIWELHLHGSKDTLCLLGRATVSRKSALNFSRRGKLRSGRE